MEVRRYRSSSLPNVSSHPKAVIKPTKSRTQLQTYTLTVLGTILVKVRYGSYVGTHTLYICCELTGANTFGVGLVNEN